MGQSFNIRQRDSMDYGLSRLVIGSRFYGQYVRQWQVVKRSGVSVCDQWKENIRY